MTSCGQRRVRSAKTPTEATRGVGGDKSGGPGDDKNLAADGDNSRPAPPTPRRAAEAVFLGVFGEFSHRGGPRARRVGGDYCHGSRTQLGTYRRM